MLIMLHTQLAQPAGMKDEEFYGIWLTEARFAVEAMKQPSMLKGVWKVAGLHEVYSLFEVESPSEFDRILANVPMIKQGYRHMLTQSYRVLSPYTEWVALLESIVKDTRTGG
jgi:muconolactone delta-isomerase